MLSKKKVGARETDDCYIHVVVRWSRRSQRPEGPRGVLADLDYNQLRTEKRGREMTTHLFPDEKETVLGFQAESCAVEVDYCPRLNQNKRGGWGRRGKEK